MPVAVAMPKIGWSMEEGTLVSWLKKEGDSVEKGEAVAIIQTEKVEYEVEALASGTLKRILAKEGQDFPPGQLLGVIAGEGEDTDDFVSNYKPVVAATPQETPSETPGVSRTRTEETPSKSANVRVSPRARKLAREHNVDLSLVKPGRSGMRITEEDVQKFLDDQQAGKRQPRLIRTLPLSGMRKVIAERMLSAAQNSPMVALTCPVDFSRAEKLRQDVPGRASHQDVVMRAVALELGGHSMLNSSLRNNEIEVYESINIGFAVAREDGLVVPVICDADRKNLAAIKAERERLMERARTRELTSEEMGGGTFTLSSLGAFGITIFTPILNPPQTAILGIGAVEQVPVVASGNIEIQLRLTLTLVFDHRVVDGAPAAAFLKAVRERIERGEIS